VSYPNDRKWFLYAEKLATKFLIHCKSLCLNAVDTFIEENSIEEKRLTEYMDIAGIFVNVRVQSDTYATLHHIFFDDVDWEIKRLRFDLWRLDSYIERYRQKASEKEKAEIQLIISCIRNNSEFKILNENHKKVLMNRSESIDTIIVNWKFIPERLDTMNKKKVSWKEIFIKSGLNLSIFENAHSFFSMYTHSNFFSTNHLYYLTKERSLTDKNFAILYSSFLITMILDDFASKFTEAQNFIAQLSELDIDIIKSFLHNGREKEKIKYIK